MRPSFYYSEPMILKCNLFGFDRVAFENEISSNLEKSGNVGISIKLDGKQAGQKRYIICIIQMIARC